ncbi:glycosyltransferase family 4 protein [Caballeronia ptereochthonis]|uniref:Group 1 family glycosyl transferase n=1 Tax=Caballeronia ptereochthonis TaxID=1777144 RepID=A0A158B1Y1_9BURK|nr:glycosyltransferase family 4 protein [Caballeronia ptereochthonis]SAK63940.1 group 1 family glycosyl transferase [Caballeronia ptereochthonis]
MKIFLLVSSMGTGGAERVAATLVNAWVARGDEVTLVPTFSGRSAMFYPLDERVRVIHLAERVPSRGSGLSRYLARVMALRALIRESRPDVLISFLPNVNVMTLLASRGLRIPVIACEHNNPSVDGRSRLWTILCRVFYPAARIVTVLTEGVVEPFRRMVPGVRTIVVMPNPLPNEVFELALAREERGGRKRIVSVGRLTAQKQFDVLIDAFAAVAGERDDVDLWIWGEGSDRANLEAQIGRLGMGGRIFLPGTTDAMWRELSGARAFAMSSRYEGLPMALMESLALGVPCVASDCPSGPRELTRDGQDGLLVPVGDREALTQALRRVVDDDSLCREMGRQASCAMRERYGLQAILPMWDRLFVRVGAAASGS